MLGNKTTMTESDLTVRSRKLLCFFAICSLAMDPFVTAAVVVSHPSVTPDSLFAPCEFVWHYAKIDSASLAVCSFLGCNLFPILGSIFGAIAAFKYCSRLGAYCAGLGSMMLFIRAIVHVVR